MGARREVGFWWAAAPEKDPLVAAWSRGAAFGLPWRPLRLFPGGAAWCSLDPGDRGQAPGVPGQAASAPFVLCWRPAPPGSWQRLSLSVLCGRGAGPLVCTRIAASYGAGTWPVAVQGPSGSPLPYTWTLLEGKAGAHSCAHFLPLSSWGSALGPRVLPLQLVAWAPFPVNGGRTGAGPVVAMCTRALAGSADAESQRC